MIRSNMESKEIMRDRRWRAFFTPSHLILPVMVIALLLGGMLEMLAPAIISNIGASSYTSRLLASLVAELVIGTLLMAIIIILRLDELVAVGVIAMSLFADWYLGLEALSVVVGLALLLIFYLARSSQHPWVKPRALWLWILFLLLALLAEIRGDRATPYDLFYYPTIIFGALIFFWLGTLVARDIVSVRRFLKILSIFGTLVALHTIILAITGIFLFKSSHFDNFLAQVSNFQIAQDNSFYRIGAFFVDPNWNGAFFAVMLCIPLGLFVESSHLLEKIFYLAETFIMLPALLFTYSGGAWIAAIVGVVVFVALIGQMDYRFLIVSFIIIGATVMSVGFPSQVNLLFQHVTASDELSLRAAIWQTAWRVIQAFPLTGVGIGLQTYLDRAAPYRVPAQYGPIDHPHNSYLELGAMAGLPVLITFVALVLFALWLASRNWTRADVKARALLSGGIAAVIALSVNSWSINAWTLPPLAATGWLILGVISSPLLAKGLNNQATKRKITESPVEGVKHVYTIF